MRRPFVHAAATLLLSLLVPHLAAAQTQSASLQQCQTLQERIERYKDLRRKGGSASQMDRWKKALREAEAEFRDKDCQAFRRELR